jgi:hypothetical protein
LASVQKIDNFINNQLIKAVRSGNFKNIIFLVEDCHANLDYNIGNGITPSTIAFATGDMTTVKYLVQQGASVKNEHSKIIAHGNKEHQREYIKLLYFFLKQESKDARSRVKSDQY